jgi:hypothetical protein
MRRRSGWNSPATAKVEAATARAESPVVGSSSLPLMNTPVTYTPASTAASSP